MSDDDDDVKGKGRDKSKGGKPKIARAGSAIANLGQDTVEDGVSTLFDVGSRLIAAIKGVRYNLQPRAGTVGFITGCGHSSTHTHSHIVLLS